MCSAYKTDMTTLTNCNAFIKLVINVLTRGKITANDYGTQAMILCNIPIFQKKHSIRNISSLNANCNAAAAYPPGTKGRRGGYKERRRGRRPWTAKRPAAARGNMEPLIRHLQVKRLLSMLNTTCKDIDKNRANMFVSKRALNISRKQEFGWRAVLFIIAARPAGYQGAILSFARRRSRLDRTGRDNRFELLVAICLM